MEETGLSGTVILMLDEDDIVQSVTYRLGDNSTRHGVQNTVLESNHTYVFYLEIIIYFENIIRSNYVKYPDPFTIDSQWIDLMRCLSLQGDTTILTHMKVLAQVPLGFNGTTTRTHTLTCDRFRCNIRMPHTTIIRLHHHHHTTRQADSTQRYKLKQVLE